MTNTLYSAFQGDEKVSSSFTRQKTLVEGFMDVTLMGKNAATFKLAVSLLSHGDGFVVAVLVCMVLNEFHLVK